MTGLLGQIASFAGLVLSLAGMLLAFFAAGRDRDDLDRLARDLSLGVFGAAVLAFGVMEFALITHDFSVQFVAQVGSRDTPLLFTIASAWSALEGSILLWVLILAGYTVAFTWWIGKRDDRDHPMWGYGLGTVLLVNAFFFLLLVGPADPFEAVYPVPADGPGPNPLLQNNWFMAVHPPILYTGYVGMAVPFGLAAGGLLGRRLDRVWSRAIRRWTLFPWSFLTLGILAGAWWSYEVLGWGGYWAWDPVENASFMPWLVGTAFLHSLMVQERRKMLKTWTVGLIVATFLLTVLGTFLTRSGILASVHAFTEGTIGTYFLAFMGVVAVGALALLAWRSEVLRGEGRLGGVVSRETAFLVNNLLFTAFTFAVLLGTLYPLVYEAVQGQQITVGEPYFDRTTLPLALALVFLAGVGPALPWGRGPRALLQRKFRWPGALALVTAGGLWVAGVRAPLALLTFALAAFSAALVVGEFLEPTLARRKAHGESWWGALRNVVLSNRRRYGGYGVHLGVLVVAVGIAGSTVYRQVDERSLPVGSRAEIGEYTVQLDSLWTDDDPHRERVVAALTLSGGENRVGQFFPSLNYYPNSPQPIGSPAVREHPVKDLYLVLARFEDDHSRATLQLIVSPLVWWIWVGGVLMGAAGLFAFWPGLGRTRNGSADGNTSVDAGSGGARGVRGGAEP